MIFLKSSPFVMPLALRQAAVKYSNFVPKPARKYLYNLRCKGDFRHKYNGVSTGVQTLCDGIEVDLCFAAGCHPKEKKLVCGVRSFSAALAQDRGSNSPHCLSLSWGERRRR